MAIVTVFTTVLATRSTKNHLSMVQIGFFLVFIAVANKARKESDYNLVVLSRSDEKNISIRR